MKIRIKLLKKWGGYKPGDIVQFDDCKGNLLLKNGTGELARPGEQASNVEYAKPPRPKRHAKAETATLKPGAETADLTPQIQPPEPVDCKARGVTGRAGKASDQ